MLHFFLDVAGLNIFFNIIMRIARQSVKSAKVTYAEIKWDIDPISEYFATWALWIAALNKSKGFRLQIPFSGRFSNH